MENNNTRSDFNGSEIAIIGMACRFPGAKNVDAFWRNLREGIESISFLTDSELESSGIDPAALSDPHYVKAAPILEAVEMFDASFFGYTPREAEIMDPQHRLFLECAWEALEHAGYDPEKYKGNIGVYTGARTNSYLFNIYSNPQIVASLGAFQIGLGNDLGFLSTRVSYKLNLRGPSYSVHTACSTSLVAVHLACQSLLIDECQTALAGGVAVNVPHKTGYLYREGNILSPDGHCRAFDAKAQGTVFGSGVGIVVLKRLADALADGDCIHAIIKGSATNNDGALKASFTAPSVSGQAEVISQALANAEVNPETISYVETHGTATALGDPIEIRALIKAFRDYTDKKGFCAIGSVKTNVGHLDAAAGTASLIKSVLALKHKMLPPSLHFEQPNPNIDFESSPFYVNSAVSEWKARSGPRRAGVSSFGVGGTNTHVILEEAPAAERSGESRPHQLLIWSAATASALQTATANLAAYSKQHPDLNLADVAYTLRVGRKAFSYRRMLVCRDLKEAITALESSDPQRVFSEFQESSDRPVVFLFPGQGTHYINMAFELYRVEPAFREQVDLCSKILEPHLGLGLHRVLYPGERDVESAREQLNQTGLSQPALFVIESALAKLWMSWGIHPQAMIGHSIGEYTAAYLAGVLSLEEALVLVAARGRLMQQQPGGAMLAVPLSEEETLPLLGRNLSLAAVNGRAQCVVSGLAADVAELEQHLIKQGVVCRRLHVSHAFHSAMMDPILEPFAERVRAVTLKAPQIPYVSNLTGTWITAAEATDPSYWAKHLRHTVQFADSMRELLKESDQIMLEVGPGQTLATLAKLQMNDLRRRTVLSSLRSPKDSGSDLECLLTSLGKLWLFGVPIDWSGFDAHERRHRIPLPTYPFERQRYWIEPQGGIQSVVGPLVKSGKDENITNWFYIPSWKRTVSPKPIRSADHAYTPRHWLVFIDDGGLGPRIVDRLKQEGEPVVTVTAGERFCKITEEIYTINPQAREDYEALLKELRGSSKIPDGIVHLWSITGRDPIPSTVDFFKKAQRLGYYSLLFLAQAFEKEGVTDLVQIDVVSNHLHHVSGAEVIHPEKATLLGPCKVIPQEYLNISCRGIDVELPLSGSWEEARLVDQLLAEIRSESPDKMIAYRGNQRWVQTYEPLTLEGDTEPIRPLREHGVYLITGGLGGVGLLLAEYLARKLKAKLILTGRSALPERDHWEGWLASHEDQDRVSQKIQKVKAMEGLGTEVMVVSADAANEQEMVSLVDRIYARFGRLDGVLHAAGVTSGPSVYSRLAEIGPTESETQFQPKVYGLYALEKVLEGRDIDCCLLFSSNASVFGGLGLVSYAAANLFMDAFACDRGKRARRSWISATWDPWPEETKKYAGFQTSMDQYAMTPEESVEAFRRVVSSATESQIVVATGDLFARFDLWIRHSTNGASAASAHPRPDINTIYVAPTNAVEQTIAQIWQEVLGIEQVGIYDNFFDLGGHSLLVTILVSRLRSAFQVDIPFGKFFESPSVAAVAKAIDELQSEQQDQEKVEILRTLEQLSEEQIDAEISKRTSLSSSSG